MPVFKFKLIAAPSTAFPPISPEELSREKQLGWLKDLGRHYLPSTTSPGNLKALRYHLQAHFSREISIKNFLDR